MVVSCIIGVARREITPLYQTGVAFERYETGVFFAKIMKRFSQQKYDESQRQEVKKGKKRREDLLLTGEIYAGNRYTLTGNRKVVKIPENIMLPRKSYGYKHSLQKRGAW